MHCYQVSGAMEPADEERSDLSRKANALGKEVSSLAPDLRLAQR